MTTRRLVITADDFGMHAATTTGIVQAMQAGVVTSTSLMVNGADRTNAIAAARQHRLDVGWHVTLTEGRPIAPPERIPSLVSAAGLFHPLPQFIRRAFLRQIQAADIECELQAQWEILYAGIGTPSHVNGHHHVHVLPVVCDVVREIVRAQRIPWVRVPREPGGWRVPRWSARLFLAWQRATQARFWTPAGAATLPFFGIALEAQADRLGAWERLFARVTTATAEVMVHPAATPMVGDRYLGHRARELARLLDPAWRALVARHGFPLAGFRDLPAPAGLP